MITKDMKNLSLVLPLIAALVVAGCVGQTGTAGIGEEDAGTTTTTEDGQTVVKETTSAKTVTVEIKNFEFTTPVVTIKKGDTVKWIQRDSVGHTVTSDNNAWESSPVLKNGETFEQTFAESGTFTYHCTPHQYMKGKVIVEE